MDYATSARYIASLDPFVPTNMVLRVPLPPAMSAFAIPHRTSANFFDLIERAEVWRRLEGLGVVKVGMVAEGVKMLGGVPT